MDCGLIAVTGWPCRISRAGGGTVTRRASNSFSVASRSVVLRPHRESSVTSTASDPTCLSECLLCRSVRSSPHS